MALLIKTDGSESEVFPKDEKRFTLKELQNFVGGLIDIAMLPSGRVIYLNDEGKLIGLPKNEKGTDIWKEEYPIEKYPHNNDQLIVGDILLMSKAEDEEQNKEDESSPAFVVIPGVSDENCHCVSPKPDGVHKVGEFGGNYQSCLDCNKRVWS